MNGESFSPRDIPLTRAEAEARDHARMMKESCKDIEDSDKAVRCFTVAQEAEQELTESFRSEESKQNIADVRDNDVIDLS